MTGKRKKLLEHKHDNQYKKKKKKGNPQIVTTPATNRSYVGYCNHSKHRGWVTIEVLSEHECLQKECPFLARCQHPLWTDPKFQTKQISWKRLMRIKEHLYYAKPASKAVERMASEEETPV